MTVLRSTTFQLHVKSENGKTQMRTFTRAVADADSTVKKLNEELGENVDVTIKSANSVNNLTQNARAQVTMMERTNKAYEKQVQELTQQIQLVDKSGVEQAALNAQFRLGATATEEQRQEVSRLATQYYQLREAQNQTGGSMRNLRGISQNLGWQLQDTVVQLQMGTDAAVVFAQQGSQMASSFGAAGALIGAGIAVIGAGMPMLMSYMDDTTASTDELKKASESLNDIFEMSEYSIQGFTDGLRELYEVDRQLAELKIIAATLDAQKVMSSARDTVKDVADELYGLGEGMRWFSTREEEFESDLQGLSENFNINTDDALRLSRAYNALLQGAPLSKFADTVKAVAISNPQASESFIEMASAITQTAFESGLAEQQLEKLKELIESGLTPANVGLNDSLYDSIDAWTDKTIALGQSEREQAKWTALLEDTNNLTTEEVDQLLTAIDTYYDRKEAIEAVEEAEKERQRNERQRQREQREAEREHERFIRSFNRLQRELDPLAGFTESYTSNLDLIQQALDKKLIGEEQYQNLSQEAWENYYDSIEDLFDDPGEELRGFTDDVGDLFGQLDNVLKNSSDNLNQTTVSSITALAETVQNHVSVMSSASDMFTSAVDEMVNGGDRVAEAVDEMNGIQQAAFFLSRSIMAAEALINGILLGSKLATLFPTAAPAMIATGTSIGAAQAGAIAGATFAGFFDDGGYIPSGQQGIVSEYGDELVNGVMVRGPANVTSRVDTAAMAQSTNLKVEVVNEIPNAAYSTQVTDEGIKLIATQVFNDNIDKGVAGVMGKKGTKTNKTLTSKYTTTNRY